MFVCVKVFAVLLFVVDVFCLGRLVLFVVLSCLLVCVFLRDVVS